MKILLYQWIKTHRTILMNASSLVGTSVVTSLLGFVYWVIAAHFFSPHILGFSSATISAMSLLGFFSTLGLGTLLMGELSRQQGKEMPLISAALLLTGVFGACMGIAFAIIAPFASADFQLLRENIGYTMLFSAGVSLSAITLVIDGAFTGLLRSELQLWRNTLFAVIKLVVLFVAGIWLSHTFGLTIYATWAIGNAFSLVILVGFVSLKRGKYGSIFLPHWRLLRKLAPTAAQHHILNLVLDVPSLALPVLVTITLSATVNAWFYVSFMLAGFTYVVPYALSLVLFAMNADQPETLAPKVRFTVSLAFAAITLANIVLQFGTKQLLGLFGHVYAGEAALSLHLLALAAFPLIIKNHYIAISRIQNRMAQATLPIAIGTFLELGFAALGAHLGGISGLSLGWIAALCLEAIFMSRTVYRVIWPGVTPRSSEQLDLSSLLYHRDPQMPEVHANKSSLKQ